MPERERERDGSAPQWSLLWSPLLPLFLPALGVLHPFHSSACRFSFPDRRSPASSPALCHPPEPRADASETFPVRSGSFVRLQTLCIAVKDIPRDFQLPTRANKSHTVSVLPKVIYFQSARRFQLNEFFPYQCTSPKLHRFA